MSAKHSAPEWPKPKILGGAGFSSTEEIVIQRYLQRQACSTDLIEHLHEIWATSSDLTRHHLYGKLLELDRYQPQTLANIDDRVKAILGECERERIIVRNAVKFYGGNTSVASSEPNRNARAREQAEWALGTAALLLPQRITRETFGDCLERLEALEDLPVRLQADALMTIFWAVMFTIKAFWKPGAALAAAWHFLFR